MAPAFWVVRSLLRIAAGCAVLAALSAPVLAQQPSEAQRNAIRQACPSDFQAHCSGVSPGGSAALACLQRNMSGLSAACRQAVAAIGGGQPQRGAAAPAGSAAGAAAPPATAAPTTRAAAPPMSPREELYLVRRSCGGDFRALCRGVPLGGGRAAACLRAHAEELSPTCRQALAAASTRR